MIRGFVVVMIRSDRNDRSAIIGDVNDRGVSGRKKVGVAQEHVQAA